MQSLGMVRLRGFGQYTMQVADPKRFVDQIVGTQRLYTTGQIQEYLRSIVISRLTDVLGESMTSILDLPQLFEEIGATVKDKVRDNFLALGIDLRQFMIVSINPTDETAKAIDERASMGAIGNLDAYIKFKTARALGDAAQSGAGGGTGEGLGLGAGIGMGAGMAGMIANAMSGVQQAGQQPQQAVPAAVPDVMTLEEAANYLKVSVEDVLSVIESGELKARKIGSQYRISKDAVDTFLGG